MLYGNCVFNLLKLRVNKLKFYGEHLAEKFKSETIFVNPHIANIFEKTMPLQCLYERNDWGDKISFNTLDNKYEMFIIYSNIKNKKNKQIFGTTQNGK